MKGNIVVGDLFILVLVGRCLQRLPSGIGYFAIAAVSIWTWHLQSLLERERGHYLIQQKGGLPKALPLLWPPARAFGLLLFTFTTQDEDAS